MTAGGNKEPPSAGRHENVTTLAASKPDDQAAVEEDEDYTSSSGPSSEDETQPYTDTQIPSGVYRKALKTQPDHDLKSRLSDFLSRIQRANRELDDAETVRAQRVDDVDETEDRYIEMNLGLGVLTEREPNEDGIRLPSPKSGSVTPSHATEEALDEHNFRSGSATENEVSRGPKIEEVHEDN